MAVVYAVILIALFCAVTYVFNETPFLYNPKGSYTFPLPEQMERPEYGAIDISNPGSDKAIVFFPGFKAAPIQLKHMLDAFKGEYNVGAVLYPGSSVSLEDFAGTNYSQWYAAAREQYLVYRKKYKVVYACGFSMGATIALTLAEEFADDPGLKPDGIISMAGLVFSNNVLGQGVYYDWRLYIIRYMSWIMRGMKKVPDLDVNAAPGPVFNDREHIFSTLYSLKMGMYSARKGLNKVDAPVLLFHSKGDVHSPFKNMAYIAANVASKTVRTKAFDLSQKQFDKYTRHFIPHYPETKDEIIGEMRDFLREISSER